MTKSIKRGADGGKTSAHLASFQYQPGKKPVRVSAWCYRCDDAHAWAEPCPAVDRR